MLKEHEKELLGKYGWVLECESPFELIHADGSSFKGPQAQAFLPEMLDSLIASEELHRHKDIQEQMAADMGQDITYKDLL